MHKTTRNVLISLLLSVAALYSSDIKEETIRVPAVKTGNAGVSLTLSDIKVALYNLLGDSASNAKEIKKISNEQSLFKKEVAESNKKTIKQIKGNTLNISNILELQKKREMEKILYEKEIEYFIEKNKNLLPKG